MNTQTNREKALKLNIEVNNILRIYRQNKAAGHKTSFERLRWIVAKKQLRDLAMDSIYQ